MKSLKRFTASVMLGLTMTVGAVQTAAAATCYAVYERIGTWYDADGSVWGVYEYRGTLCLD